MTGLKKVLLLIPNLDFGGAQRSFCSLANALGKTHKVYVSVFNTSNGIAFDFDAEIIDLGIPAGNSFLSKAVNFIKRCQSVRRLKRQLDIDTTISYLEGANYVNILSGSRDKKILSVRGSILLDENLREFLGSLRVKLLMPICYRLADHIVALNHGIRNELTETMGIPFSRVSVIRNFYDVTYIEQMSKRPLAPAYEPLTRSRYLIYAGRLSKEKRVHRIIDLYQVLSRTNPDLRLVIAGDGLERDTLIARCTSLNLSVFDGSDNLDQQQVLFIGYQSNPYNLLSKASVLLIASTAEGGPNILRESMICNTLIISTNCPYGPAELLMPTTKWVEIEEAVEGEYGVLLPMNTGNRPQQLSESWAGTVQLYLNDEPRRNKIINSANAWARQQSIPQTLEKWVNIINREY